jgi:gluconolactonase
MTAPLNDPRPEFTPVASMYKGKKFNSPNDLVIDGQQDIYFTDPPYGLEKQLADPARQLSFQGVYKVKHDGTVILLVDSLTRPNGLAFLPGDSTLIIANSDSSKPYWYSYRVRHDSLVRGKIFYSAAGFDPAEKGLPDGLKVDHSGHVFATGPGGVWIFDHTGKLLGKINLSAAASNCALTPDQKTLFITNDMYVLRVRLGRTPR